MGIKIREQIPFNFFLFFSHFKCTSTWSLGRSFNLDSNQGEIHLFKQFYLFLWLSAVCEPDLTLSFTHFLLFLFLCEKLKPATTFPSSSLQKKQECFVQSWNMLHSWCLSGGCCLCLDWEQLKSARFLPEQQEALIEAQVHKETRASFTFRVFDL